MLTGLIAVSLLTAFSARRIAGSYPDSPQYQADAGKFHNPVPQPRDGVGKMLGIIWNMLWHKPRDATPQHPPLPLQPLTRADLLAAPDRSLFRLGHSTVLLKLRGQFWLTDPVFSERASPLQWMGPKRFHAPPISIEDLPPLQAVILSHDHYDHLDQDAITQLAGKTRQFVTPLGVGDRLAEWGVPRRQIRQLDWWQQVDIEGLRLLATPAQHFSGRTPFDGNQTLWASWAIIDDDFKIFFSGDSGYFDGFKTIGEKLGPFDLTLMETGAYDPQWPYVHMQPAQTLQAHLDLRGKWLLPVHNGTFDLAMHDWYDPFEKIAALARQNEVLLATPEMGERLDMQQPQATRAWWRYADDVAVAEPGLAGTTQPSR
ncbi:hydrolase [Pseudoxanthomonas dokdonensis]|uniref:Hydrolase n=1 Tax=Pseudoxanthomonas dokdonensis TaxID=344882 RepID=A0A0R0CEM9_9GAMM|nr:hydrolase [Pseudoxanthomonas dokdonensis]